MSHKAKILTLDIETAPIRGKVWGLWDQNISLNQIESDWFILSACAKWAHEDTVWYKDLRGVVDLEDDHEILEALWKLLDEADIVVGQNSVKFDIKKINARFIMSGMPPPSPYKQVDTMIMARKTFGFTSNKLEYLTRHAKLSTIPKRLHGNYPGMDLWNAVAQDIPAAWEEMELYNIDDVRSTEQVYFSMLPWTPNHPNVNIYDDDETMRCHRCGSPDIKPRGYYFTNTGKFQRYCCSACGGWTSDKKVLNSKAKRQSLTRS